MSRYEQGGYLPPFAPYYKKKIAFCRKIFAHPGIAKGHPRRARLGAGASGCICSIFSGPLDNGSYWEVGRLITLIPNPVEDFLTVIPEQRLRLSGILKGAGIRNDPG
jgi:hypothetical protein